MEKVVGEQTLLSSNIFHRYLPKFGMLDMLLNPFLAFLSYNPQYIFKETIGHMKQAAKGLLCTLYLEVGTVYSRYLGTIGTVGTMYILDIRKNAPCQQGRTSLHQSHKQAVSLESKLKYFSCLDHQPNWAVSYM